MKGLAPAVILSACSVCGLAAPAIQPLIIPAIDAAAQLKQAAASMAQINQQRDILLAQLQAIEKQYGANAGSLRDLNLRIDDKRQRLNTLSVQIKQKQASLSQQQQALTKQITSAFVMGKNEKLKLLLNQQNPALASRMMVYYDYINQARLKKLAGLKEEIAFLGKLEQDKQQTADSLEDAVQTQKITQANLAKTQQQRDSLLAQLKRDFALKSQQLTELEETEQQIETLMQNLQQNPSVTVQQAVKLSPVNASNNSQMKDVDGNLTSVDKINPAYAVAVNKPFASLKGHLLWPAKGAIIRRFGSRRSDTRWDGVLIGAKEGSDIYAVSSGRVVFADWLRGYGLLTIVDHGQGYMTLYAFNQSLYKKVGDTVKAGTAIAAVGKSDGRDEAGLYFGIRSNGKAINPVTWCK